MSEIRIIAGQYRRRKITVIDAPDLRPTADRGRETLFNWLQHHLTGAVCLDAFAGSGALGFEACSRGAQHAVLIEQQLNVFNQLQKTQALLQCNHCQLIHGNALDWLSAQAQLTHNRINQLNVDYSNQNPPQKIGFDIIFLDPPFRDSQLLTDMLILLTSQDALNANGFAYLELPEAFFAHQLHANPGNADALSIDRAQAALPETWQQYARCIKQQRIGQSRLQLWQKK
jgi:16S rRNA (guanine966-N2)-methyltransferase